MMYYWEKKRISLFLLGPDNTIFLYHSHSRRGYCTTGVSISDVRIDVNLLIQGFKI